MNHMFFFALAIISTSLCAMTTVGVKPKEERIFRHLNTQDNVKFFKASGTLLKQFEGAPQQALDDYAKMLAHDQKPSPEQEKALLKNKDVIVAFMHAICPQVELEGRIPAANACYVKASPTTYLYNDTKQDHVSAGFLGTLECSVKADLLLPLRGYYCDLVIERMQHTSITSKRIKLRTPAACVAIDPRNVQVYVGFSDGGIGIFDVKDKITYENQPYQKLLSCHTEPIQAIRFFYDNYLFVSKTVTEVIIWHTDTQRPLLRLDATKCGHEHLFNRVIVRSHAGPGWNQDLEYVIPYMWTNFDTYNTSEQLAYVYLLLVLYNGSTALSPEFEKLLVAYLLRNCFAVGFEEIIAQAFQKYLQSYLQKKEHLAVFSIPIRLLPQCAQSSYCTLLFNKAVPRPDIGTEKMESAVLSFFEQSNLLDSLPQEVQEAYSQDQNNFALKTRKTMPRLFTVEPQQASADFMKTHIIFDENKLEIECLATVKEKLALPIPCDSDLTQSITKDIIIQKISLNFLPLAFQMAACKLGYDRKQLDLSCYTSNRENITKFFQLPSLGHCIALNSKRAPPPLHASSSIMSASRAPLIKRCKGIGGINCGSRNLSKNKRNNASWPLSGVSTSCEANHRVP